MADLSETLLRDVRATLGDAEDWQRAVAVDPNAVEEVMATFSNIPKADVERILAKNGSSIDRSIPELFALYNDLTARAQEEARQRQLQETAALLERSFAGMAREVISEVLERCSGDIAVASEELLSMMRAQQERDEEKLRSQRDKDIAVAKERERLQRERLVDHCVLTFDRLSRAEVVDTLHQYNYDVARAVPHLRELSCSRKLRNLQHIFRHIPEHLIRAALEAADWSLPEAFAILSAPKEQPQQQQQQQQQQQPSSVEQSVSAAVRAAEGDAMADPQAKALMQTILRDATGPKNSDNNNNNNNNNNNDVKSEPQQQPAAQDTKALDDVASQPADQKLSVSLSVSSSSLRYGESVTVTSTVSGGQGSSPYDWLGLFDARNTNNASPLTWKWFAPQVTLQLPSYGVFEVRYLRKINGVPVALASSEKVRCGPAMKLRVEERTHDWLVSCEWDNATEAVTSSAWIGLFVRGAPDTEYLAFNWVKKNVAEPVSFLRRQLNGTYEFRFFPYKFQPVAFSEPIEVHQKDCVELHREDGQCRVVTTLSSIDPTKDTRCWVAVCFANDSRSSAYRRYNYIATPRQTHMFKTPIHTGIYEARIYDSKANLLAKSEPISIVGVD